jgi:hypothetical protein
MPQSWLVQVTLQAQSSNRPSATELIVRAVILVRLFVQVSEKHETHQTERITATQTAASMLLDGTLINVSPLELLLLGKSKA